MALRDYSPRWHPNSAPSGYELVEGAVFGWAEDDVGVLVTDWDEQRDSIVASPGASICRLPLLAPVERNPVRAEQSDTRADHPRGACVHEWFEAQVERTPNAVAVVFQDERMSYEELNRRANQVAHHLRMLGVGPEVIVGICAERSLEMVVGLLGILKSGGAYLPLDPAYPKERLALMLEETCAPILLTQERLRASLPECVACVRCLDMDWGSIAQESEENPIGLTMAENLAYVVYTSGSTGQPKGVLVEHRSLVNYAEAASIEFDIEPGDRVLQFASISWDTCAEEIFPCLTRGATLVLRTDSMASSIAAFLTKCREWGLTVLDLPSAYWHELTAMLCAEALPFPPSVRLVITGGERVLPERLVEWYGHVDGAVRIMNAYGLSEATAISTVYECSEVMETDAPLREVPIGRPIRNVRTYVLDPSLQPVPVGGAGELYVGGEGLARGYLNRPDLTAERFIPDPFSDRPGERIYRTGDLARYLPDGNLEFLGRIDDQVKIRGFRIELREVEAALGQHPAVRQAVVVVREDEPGDKRLVAYVIPNGGAAPNLSDLRGFLKRALPDYMVPSAFVLIKSLPLTPNGKVDRRELPAPDALRPVLEGTFTGPRDKVERWLTGIWEEILGIHPIGVRDNFFDLGGHSLLAARLFARIEKVFAQSLPMSTLFHAPTIEQLAGVLRGEKEKDSSSWTSLMPIQPGGSQPPFFCVHGGHGRTLTFGTLSRHLGPDQPFYAFQARGIDGEQSPHTRIEDYAAEYVMDMQAIQPEGPYFLGGFCSGGTIAFEMAQQLRAQGHEVAMLALLDARRVVRQPRSRLGRRVLIHVGNVLRLSVSDKLEYLLDKVRGVTQTAKHSIKTRGEAPSARDILDRVIDCAEREYVPQIYPGRMILFRPGEQPAEYYLDPYLGWEGLAAGGIEVRDIPTGSGTMFREPHVQTLARELRASMEAGKNARLSAGRDEVLRSGQRA